MQDSSSLVEWPAKSREFHSNHFDSTIWNALQFRDDDIVIATYAKSGTTWVQQIVGQLLSKGAADVEVGARSPWLDLRIPPKAVKLPLVEAQEGRRYLKTHLPVDALVFSPRAKYLYIGRDGRDVAWSAHNHFFHASAMLFEGLNETPGLVGPKIARPGPDVRQFFLEWLEQDGFPLWPFWENIRSWWAIRALPNVKLLHFAALKADLAASIREIAAFLDIPIDEADFAAILEHSGFEWMKTHAAQAVPMGGILWEGGAETFIHKGSNGRWRDILTADDNARYEAMALEQLGPDCAAWLKTGERPD